MPFYIFTVGLIVFPIQLWLKGIVLGSFFFSKALFSLLLTLALAGFFEDFFFALFFSSKSLLSLDSDCSSGICIASNVDMLSKFSKAIVILKVMFL